MALVVGFDVYGTLVDPYAMRQQLAAVVGPELADRAAITGRAKQVDHTFRSALMRRYVDFDTCTRRALEFTLAVLGIDASKNQKLDLLDGYLRLPAFPDAKGCLRVMRQSGARIIAFSQGTERSVRAVLEQAAMLEHFDDVVSADDLHTFKPDPVVNVYLVERGGSEVRQTWLVSANDWDIMGAAFAGLRTAWVRRDPTLIFDLSGVEPDLVVAGLGQLPRDLERVTAQRGRRRSMYWCSMPLTTKRSPYGTNPKRR